MTESPSGPARGRPGQKASTAMNPNLSTDSLYASQRLARLEQGFGSTPGAIVVLGGSVLCTVAFWAWVVSLFY